MEPCDERNRLWKIRPFHRFARHRVTPRVSSRSSTLIHKCVLITVVILAAIFPALTPLAIAQDEGSTPAAPIDLATQLGLDAGISLIPLAQGTINQLPPAPVDFVLEQIELSPGQQQDVSQTLGPELIYISIGNIVAVDSLGFSAPLPQGDQVLFNQGFGYSLKNEADKPAQILRLTLHPATGTDTATPVATPAAGGSSSLPVILFEKQLDQLPASPATLFLGEMSWDPETETGQYWQDGWFGIRLEVGNISLLSPSGLPVPMDMNSPQIVGPRLTHNEGNPGPNKAVGFVFALVDASGPIFSPGAPPAEATPTS
jgi:hypothetical protein